MPGEKGRNTKNGDAPNNKQKSAGSDSTGDQFMSVRPMRGLHGAAFAAPKAAEAFGEPLGHQTPK